MDALTVLAGFVALVALVAVASLVVGGVPERKTPTSPRTNGDFDIWLFF